MPESTRPRLTPHDHFGRLLVLLLAAFLCSGIHGDLGRILGAVFGVAALVSAVTATALPRLFPRAALVVGGGLLAVVGLVATSLDSDTSRGIGSLCLSVALLGVLCAVLGRVLEHKEITGQTLAGALCAYILIGLVFSGFYAALDYLADTPVFNEAADQVDYSYFSFVTLTTVGYGDIVAVSEFGQRVAVVEAMTGQVFLAVAVARVVSLLGNVRRRRAEDSPAE